MLLPFLCNYFATQSTLKINFSNLKLLIMKNKRLIFILIVTAVLLMLPLIAMQFDTGVDWGIRDFTIMGVMLFGTGLLIDLVLRKVHTLKYRLLLCGAILFAFFLLWAELAVGIFNSPIAGS